MNLIISNQAISTHNGLFSLNDLHKVSGNADKHKPTNFLRNEQTKNLIAELENENVIAYHTVQGGNTKTTKQGTYACRELVYAYAMWISAKFSLMVIRAFDALNTGAIACLPKTTAHDRTPLRQAVTALVAKYGLMHDEGYHLVHQYMGVNSIDEIPIDDLPEAVAYVHRLMLGTINDRELYDVLVSCAIHLKQFGTMLSSLHAHGYYADDDNPIDPATRCYNYLVRVVDKMNLRNIHGVPMFANNKINFYNGFSRPI